VSGWPASNDCSLVGFFSVCTRPDKEGAVYFVCIFEGILFEISAFKAHRLLHLQPDLELENHVLPRYYICVFNMIILMRLKYLSIYLKFNFNTYKFHFHWTHCL